MPAVHSIALQSSSIHSIASSLAQFSSIALKALNELDSFNVAQLRPLQLHKPTSPPTTQVDPTLSKNYD